MRLRARGLNQAEISRELGLSRSTVNRYWKLSVNQPQ
ncbi:helix-turn-helix domain-containing protein [Pseudomonas fragi]|nr:helix-turn-helix domain-containing protein [Pseudomonas fragi]